MPINASGSMTDLSMHPQWLTLIFLLMQKSQNVRFIGRQILFGAFMAKDPWHGVIFPAYRIVVMPERFTKSVPADGLELTHSTSGARLP